MGGPTVLLAVGGAVGRDVEAVEADVVGTGDLGQKSLFDWYWWSIWLWRNGLVESGNGCSTEAFTRDTYPVGV